MLLVICKVMFCCTCNLWTKQVTSAEVCRKISYEVAIWRLIMRKQMCICNIFWIEVTQVLVQWLEFSPNQELILLLSLSLSPPPSSNTESY